MTSNTMTTGTDLGDRNEHRHLLTTETKASFKTTEFFVYIAAVLAVAITAYAVDGDAGSADPFGAVEALRYITYLTIGYMIARGLAKAGSRTRSDA